jgi:hypothetical protein
MKKHLLISALLGVLLATSISGLAQGNLIIFTNWNVQARIDGIVTPDSNTLAYGYGFVFQEGGGTISQTFGTVPGFYYALTFSAIEYQGTNNVSFNLNGSQTPLTFTTRTAPVNDGYGVINTNFQAFSFNFMATSITATLSFNYFPQVVVVPDPPGQDFHYGVGAIYNVSVSAVPEPPPIALLGMGVGVGVLIYMRRRKVKGSKRGSSNWRCCLAARERLP